MEIPEEILFGGDLGTKEKIILAVLNQNESATNPELVQKARSTAHSTRQLVYNLIKKGFIIKEGYGKFKTRKVNWKKLSDSYKSHKSNSDWGQKTGGRNPNGE